MRRYRVPLRRVIFIGVEGVSDRAFVTFLQNCCDEKGLHLHLNVGLGHGGDSVSVVEEAARYLNRHPGRQDISDKLVLLDSDRIEQDKQAGRDAQSVASKEKLKLIFLRPNLEGVLLRLHEGHERRKIGNNAEAELRKVWPSYSKQLTADQLSQRFVLSDLQRAAQYDGELKRLLKILGL
ncbi:MAG: hypothetical protein OXG87_22585 [Gemmatimonadetes bacterium]|nr:hypothetical protein [Gemmatimonadota bacterium]